ncbi:uncharacterized protein LOC144127589 [Amblyomma americanum]
MATLCRFVTGLVLLATLIGLGLPARVPPPRRVRVLRDGRCIFEGRKMMDGFITLRDGTCLQAQCRPEERIVEFSFMEECMLRPPGRGCFYMRGSLEDDCCKPSIACR